jgi:HEAT repeat protein
MTMSIQETPVEVFCSYAPEDEQWVQKLEAHLKELQLQKLISLWHRRLIAPGTNWQHAVDVHLETASIILLLISSDFFLSDYCSGIEMRRALERAERNETYVIALLLRHVEWRDTLMYALPRLPTPNKPVATWSDQDEAFSSIAAGIRAAANQIRSAPDRNSLPPLRFKTITTLSGQPAMTLEEAEAVYRQHVVQEYSPMNFSGLPGVDRSLANVSLEDVFVRLALVTERARLTPASVHTSSRERESNSQEPVSLEQALRSHLLIVGEPGAGKSTLFRWLAVTFAQGRQREANCIGPTADSERLPVLLELGHLSHSSLMEEGSQMTDWPEVLSEEVIKHTQFRHLSADLFQHALQEGRCLLLFDGLDEIADHRVRTRIARSLARVPRLFPGNRVVIGTRPSGLTAGSEGAISAVFRQCQIQRFTDHDLIHFLLCWYWLDQNLSPAEREEEVVRLYRRIRADPGTLNLARTPLLATLLLLIWRKEGALPERRVDLYERFCKMLVEQWEQGHTVQALGDQTKELFAELGWEQHLELLAPIAYEIYSQGGRNVIGQRPLQKLLEELLQAQKLCVSPSAAASEATHFLNTLALRSGLLQSQGDGSYGFPHQTIQEYLVARHIAAQPNPMPINLIMEHLHDSWWQEVHLLTIGRLGAGPGSVGLAATLLQKILHLYRPPAPLLRASRYAWLRAISPGRWLLGIQFARRLAWLLQRELILACWGAAECDSNLLPPELLSDLGTRAAVFTRTACADDALRPLLENWLSSPGHHLPDQVKKAIVQELLPFVRHQDEDVRRSVVERLGQIGHGQEAAIQALIAALEDQGGMVDIGYYAGISLGKIGYGHQAAIQALRKALDSSSGFVAAAAYESLKHLTSVQAAHSAQRNALISRWGVSDEFLRQASAESEGQVGRDQEVVIPALLEGLQSPEYQKRRGALEMLEPFSKHPAVIPAMLTVLRDPIWYVRRDVATILGRIGSGQEEVISALLAYFHDPASPVRRAAVESLADLAQGREEVIVALIDLWQHEPDSILHMCVGNNLRKVASGQQMAVPLLQAALIKSQNVERRRQMVTSLWMGMPEESGQDLATAVLLTALSDADAYVRQWAAKGLGHVGNGQKDVIPALLKALHDPERGVRSEAAESLGAVASGQEQVIAALLKALHDPEKSVRAHAAESLGKVASDQELVIVALLRVLKERDYVGTAAAKGLERMKIADPTEFRQALRLLHRFLYGSSYYSGDERNVAVKAISQLVAGRALPGKPLRSAH